MNKIVIILLLAVVGCGGTSASEADILLLDSGTIETSIEAQGNPPDADPTKDSASPEAGADPDSGLDAGFLEASTMDTFVAEASVPEAAVLDSATTETSLLEASAPEASPEAGEEEAGLDSGIMPEAGQDADVDAGACGGLCPASQCEKMPAPYESFCNFCGTPGFFGTTDEWCGSSTPVPAADANLIFSCVYTVQDGLIAVPKEGLVDGSLTGLCYIGQTCVQGESNGQKYASCQ